MTIVALLMPLAGPVDTASAGPIVPASPVGGVDSAPTRRLVAHRRENDLEEARAAFDALRLEDAVAILESLVTSPDTPAPLRSRAWLLLGQTRASLVDDAGAATAFAAALSIDRSLTLPDDASPKVQALFDRTRASLLTSAPPPVPATTSEPTTVTNSTTTTTTDLAAAPPSTSPTAATGGPWIGVLAVTGSVLVVGAAAAGIGAALADDALGRPVAGRSRAEYDEIRSLGLASLGGSLVLAAAGAASLVAGVFWFMPTEPPP